MIALRSSASHYRYGLLLFTTIDLRKFDIADQPSQQVQPGLCGGEKPRLRLVIIL
jgi:hypothetical protein